ncbi:hypothetical protein [Mucilaginibacter lappiensis]|uniref:Uncharacterized protein n=1 Tax=Mucilaginibacter lappiensis TaxID=354630 RepID=A0A841JGT8_9SPHI|nr:hypothetical protein [Mucilaginibacter lappiensis]MBB6112720.1 hypothetical protein [Mucilaginibacter lappiensis]MBB6129744.1 hypothetical protein [Mucilaginibacter lappiensis]
MNRFFVPQNDIFYFNLFPVSRTASAENRQNMMACVEAGALANLAEALGMSERSRGKV